jgi:hypothetical protein
VLQADIANAQKRIAALNEEKAPVAAELRKVEAEVGPVKYIAALIYGDDPDANVLEKAVRWVIIILVMVFDPLAVMMLLASTESIKWEKDRRASTTKSRNDEESDTESDTEEQCRQRKTQVGRICISYVECVQPISRAQT